MATIVTQDKEIAFDRDRVSKIVKAAVETQLLFETEYQHSQVSGWVNRIIENCMKGLTELKKPFKYIVTCVIIQNNGAGFHSASSCFWESTDGSYVHKMDGKYLYCVTQVFALSL